MVVSFLGLSGSKAKLVGVYRLLGHVPAGERPPSQALVDAGCTNVNPEKDFYYEMEEVSGFEDLKGRVIIDWGKAAVAWHQWACSKEVVQILPAGFVRPFPGYLDFMLSFEELRSIIQNPDANADWRTMLSGVAGVYLIADLKTGAQYVGSAYGTEGIWGRWSEYAASGHGGNVKLQALLADDPGYANNFQFTILRTLPKTLTMKEVLGFERLYKDKLGTRAFGLNLN